LFIDYAPKPVKLKNIDFKRSLWYNVGRWISGMME